MGRWLRTAAAAVTVAAGALLCAASLLPLAETDAWWIRVLDFPRAQYLVALLVVGILLVPTGALRHVAGQVVGVTMVLAVWYNLYKLWVYPPFTPERAVSVASCPEGARLRVMIANVQLGNRRADELIALVRRHDPDLFFAMETDAWWDRRLAALAPAYPHRVQHVGEHHYGLHLFSKNPLRDTEIRTLARPDVPTLFTEVQLPDGARVRFMGVHPIPPLPSQPSTVRDAQILAAAWVARRSPAPAVVAGDLNAVPWERVVRRAMRIGGLLDPRVGRGAHPTFVKAPPALYWPLDHVLYQGAFGLVSFETLPRFGSDHLPVVAELCHEPGLASTQTPPPLAEDDLREAIRSMEAGLTPEARRWVLGDRTSSR